MHDVDLSISGLRRANARFGEMQVRELSPGLARLDRVLLYANELS